MVQTVLDPSPFLKSWKAAGRACSWHAGQTHSQHGVQVPPSPAQSPVKSLHTVVLLGFRTLLMTQIIYNVFWKRGAVSIGSQSREHLNVETKCCTAISSSLLVFQYTLVKSVLQVMQCFNQHSFMQRVTENCYTHCLHSCNCKELSACKGSVEGLVRGVPNSHRSQEFGTDILIFFK